VGEDQNGFERETGLKTPVADENPTEVPESSEAEVSRLVGAEADTAGADVENEAHTAECGEWGACSNMSFYEFFLRRMETQTGKEPKTIEQLLGELDISKAQLTAWLKRGTEEGKLKKTKAPVRYAWLAPESKPKQASIF
jgi:predicted Rossmann fold nucleotide-binding protein DprA/Smf involved in DNA uptake